MKPIYTASELSKSYVSASGKLILVKPPRLQVSTTAKAILKELPTSIISLVVAMFLTQLYLLFLISQLLQLPARQESVTVSLFLFVMLGVFIGIAFILGWSLVTEKEEALQKAAQLRKTQRL